MSYPVKDFILYNNLVIKVFCKFIDNRFYERFIYLDEITCFNDSERIEYLNLKIMAYYYFDSESMRMFDELHKHYLKKYTDLINEAL